jgi:sugar/nucleoside kinase (ribokinase family)
MRDRGVDVASVCVDETIGTGLSVILARANDRAILTYPGSIPDLKYHEIDFDLISRSRHLHLSGYYLLDELRPRVTELFQKAKAMGLSLSLDTNYDPKEVWNSGLRESLKYVDVFLPNETEAGAISGRVDLDEALNWYARSVGITAVKLGKKGACVKNGNQPSVFQKTAAVEVVDTVGAGDSFNSGFIYGYLQDWPIAEALKLGVACGTLSTRRSGGTSGQATLLEAEAFINDRLE